VPRREKSQFFIFAKKLAVPEDIFLDFRNPGCQQATKFHIKKSHPV
jgi:hypothetical protein